MLARAKHREWLSEIESRVANIRAEKKGEGRLLTPKDARALAGEWYHWFTERHIESAQPAAHWEDLRERVGDKLRDEVLLHADSSQRPMRLMTFGNIPRRRVKTCGQCLRTGAKRHNSLRRDAWC